eukprot:TRINITY_DN2184_c1_g3_i1.p1 TRINITY_DN2184_c1_g3~~TRINITY_DN2184_c1_g3_i1.p1  ORF type:complete len:759 (-),score=213.93 TRINITY_DN2184_c1_g3_i1:55-2151(-)
MTWRPASGAFTGKAGKDAKEKGRGKGGKRSWNADEDGNEEGSTKRRRVGGEGPAVAVPKSRPLNPRPVGSGTSTFAGQQADLWAPSGDVGENVADEDEALGRASRPVVANASRFVAAPKRGDAGAGAGVLDDGKPAPPLTKQPPPPKPIHKGLMMPPAGPPPPREHAEDEDNGEFNSDGFATPASATAAACARLGASAKAGAVPKSSPVSKASIVPKRDSRWTSSEQVAAENGGDYEAEANEEQSWPEQRRHGRHWQQRRWRSWSSTQWSQASDATASYDEGGDAWNSATSTGDEPWNAATSASDDAWGATHAAGDDAWSAGASASDGSWSAGDGGYSANAAEAFGALAAGSSAASRPSALRKPPPPPPTTMQVATEPSWSTWSADADSAAFDGLGDGTAENSWEDAQEDWSTTAAAVPEDWAAEVSSQPPMFASSFAPTFGEGAGDAGAAVAVPPPAVLLPPQQAATATALDTGTAAAAGAAPAVQTPRAWPAIGEAAASDGGFGDAAVADKLVFAQAALPSAAGEALRPSALPSHVDAAALLKCLQSGAAVEATTPVLRRLYSWLWSANAMEVRDAVLAAEAAAELEGGSGGGPAAVLVSLLAGDRAVAYWACHLVGRLAAGHPRSAERLAESGVIDAICALVESNPLDAEVHLAAVSTLRALTLRGGVALQRRVLKAGAVRRLLVEVEAYEAYLK